MVRRLVLAVCFLGFGAVVAEAHPHVWTDMRSGLMVDAQGMITGIRAEQSPNRQDMTSLEWDAAFSLLKYHPLFDWTCDQVRAYIHQHQIPYNPLHDKGFVSIGCAPCTRAIQPGEDFRAGRWWWEDASKKECGLHTR